MKVGVVGCGRIATAVHMPSLKHIQGYDLVAASDLNQARLEEVKQKFEIDEAYDDYRRMLAKADIDAVLVCTPPEHHFQVVMDSLEWGKHVLCEKPLASTFDEALTVKKAYEMQRKTAPQQLFLMPAHNFIFTPCFVEALKVVESGRIGKIKKIDACIATNLQFYGAKSDFRNQAKCGVLEDLFPHLLYLVQRLGGPLEKVDCIEPQLKGGVVSVVDVKASLAHGAQAELTAKWIGLMPTLKFDVIGENGEIEMNILRTPYNIAVTENGQSRSISLGPRLRQYIDVLRFKHPSYANEHLHFLKCAQGETEPQVSVDDGVELVRALNTVTDCYQGNACASLLKGDTVVVLRENGDTIDATVQKSVDMLGGLGIKKNDLVLVKPNVCFPKNPDGMIITDPKLLGAVLDLAKKKSKNVIVVESDAASGTAEKRLSNTGTLDVVKKCGAEFFNLSKDDVEEHKVAGLTLALPKMALRADYIINVPKFKTNMDVILSIAMKNMFGFVAPQKKTYLHSRLAEVVVYLNKIVRQDLIITDGIVAMEGLGPILGNKVDLGLIISGRNAVTVDAACCQIAGLNPYAVEPLWRAHQQNMGEIDPQRIHFVGEDINTVKCKFSRPTLSKNNITQLVKTELRLRLRR
ncbi:MAG TPA: DUF362 domain-containing protein [Candidatus Bathyarchaeia archaeon]|nr:DUF362 domain-containing protein [Candidatus Bathyarchaeia archaeon]